MKDLTILFDSLCHKGRANINAWAQLSTQSEVVMGLSCCFVSKHYPFEPFKLTKLDNLQYLVGHNHFKNLPIQFVHAMCSVGPHVGLKLEAIIPKSLWGARFNELPTRTFLQLFYLSFCCI